MAAEPVGLALGVLGLSSLGSDFIKAIHAAGNLAEDFARLQWHVKCEQTRLKDWQDRWRSEEDKNCLDNLLAVDKERLRSIFEGITRFQQRMTDFHRLLEKYRYITTQAPFISDDHLVQLVFDTSSQSREEQERRKQKDSSTFDKIIWIISHKKKLQMIAEELNTINDALVQIATPKATRLDSKKISLESKPHSPGEPPPCSYKPKLHIDTATTLNQSDHSISFLSQLAPGEEEKHHGSLRSIDIPQPEDIALKVLQERITGATSSVPSVSIQNPSTLAKLRKSSRPGVVTETQPLSTHCDLTRPMTPLERMPSISRKNGAERYSPSPPQTPLSPKSLPLPRKAVPHATSQGHLPCRSTPQRHNFSDPDLQENSPSYQAQKFAPDNSTLEQFQELMQRIIAARQTPEKTSPSSDPVNALERYAELFLTDDAAAEEVASRHSRERQQSRVDNESSLNLSLFRKISWGESQKTTEDRRYTQANRLQVPRRRLGSSIDGKERLPSLESSTSEDTEARNSSVTSVLSSQTSLSSLEDLYDRKSTSLIPVPEISSPASPVQGGPEPGSVNRVSDSDYITIGIEMDTLQQQIKIEDSRLALPPEPRDPVETRVSSSQIRTVRKEGKSIRPNNGKQATSSPTISSTHNKIASLDTRQVRVHDQRHSLKRSKASWSLKEDTCTCTHTCSRRCSSGKM